MDKKIKRRNLPGVLALWVTYTYDRFVAVGDTILVSKKDAVPIVMRELTDKSDKSVKIRFGNVNAIVFLPILFSNHSRSMMVQLFTPAGKMVYRSLVTPDRDILLPEAKNLPAGTYVVKLADHATKTASAVCIVGN